MTDPSPVPWGAVWIGLVVFISGWVLVLGSLDEQKVKRTIGVASMIVGVALALGAILINVMSILANAFHPASR